MCQRFHQHLRLWIFLICSVILSIPWTKASYYESDLPQFILEPPDTVYFSTTPYSQTQSVPKFDLTVIVSTSNVSIQLAALQRSKSDRLIYLPTLHTQDFDRSFGNAFAQPYAKIRSESISSTMTNVSLHKPDLFHMATKARDWRMWTAAVYHLMPEMRVCFLVTSRLGTIRSRAVQIKETILPDFPRYADEHLSLLIGNTARLICHLPMSEPSLPSVTFHHNGIELNLDPGTDDRYRLIYVGGYGTGLPWEEQVRKQPFRRIHWPKPDKFGQSAVLLIIHSLKLSDSGQYRCQAHLGNRTVMSEQRILLTVTKPHEKVPARLKFSSDDLDLAYLYNNISPNDRSRTGNGAAENSVQNGPNSELIPSGSSTREFLVPEGYNLTLFCIYEAAPMVSTRWYFEDRSVNVRIDKQFGILSIGYVSISNEGIYSCSAETPHSKPQGKSFRVRVLRNPQRNPKSHRIIHATPGEAISMHCNSLSPHKYKASDQKQFEKPYYQPMGSNSVEPESSMSNQSHLSSFDDQFQMGWIHDGQSIMESINNVKYDLKGATLRILNITNSDSGIYQCITQTDNLPWATDYHVLAVNRGYKTGLSNEASKSEDSSIKEYTKEGLTGHLNCNISSSLNDNLLLGGVDGPTSDNQYAWSLLWYRGPTITEPLNIEASNKASGGIKYILSSVTEGNQILSVVNPKKGTDDGQYTCRVYDTTTGKLLGEQKFQLIIHSSNEHVDLSPNLSDFRPAKISKTEEHQPISKNSVILPNNTESVQTKPGQRSNMDNKESRVDEIREKSDLQQGDQNSISRPQVRRLAQFLTAIHISWTIDNDFIPTNLTYQIEVRREIIRRQIYRNLTKRDIRSRLDSDSSEMEDSMSNLIRLPLVTSNTSALVNYPQLIQPGSVYSFRIIGSQRQHIYSRLSDSFVSPWSYPISFAQMLDTAPQIISLTPLNSSSLSVEWIYFPSSNLSNFAEMSRISMHFILIYRKLPENVDDRKSLLDLWKNDQLVYGNAKLSGIRAKVPGFRDLAMQFVEGGISQRKAILSGLEEQTTYAVSVYGKQTETSNSILHSSNEFDWFTPLSNEAIQKTLFMNYSKAENLMAETIAPDEKLKTVTSNTETSQSALKTTLFSTTFNLHQHESYVLIVILGSLAGVLMVAFIALTTFCIWYKVRIKNRLGRAYYDSPSEIDNGDNSMHQGSKEHELLTSNQISPQNSNQLHQTLPYDMSNLQMHQYTWARQRASFLDTSTMATNYNHHGGQTAQYPTTTWSEVHPLELNQAMSMYLTQQHQTQTTGSDLHHQQTQNKLSAYHGPNGPINSSVPNDNPFLGTLGLLRPQNFYSPITNFDLVPSNHNLINTTSLEDGALESTKFNDSTHFTGLDRENREFIPINDQSSSIYSHIDSESTNHELSNWNLDKCNSAQSDQIPSRTLADPFLNSDFHSSSNGDKSNQPISFYLTPSNLNQVQMDKLDPYGALWYHLAPKYPNDPNSFYTTVPPFRHIQFPLAENPLVSPIDPVLLGQNTNLINHHQMIHPYMNDSKSSNQMIPTSIPMSLTNYSTANGIPNDTFEPIHSLTAAMTLQQWVENMSPNMKIAKNQDFMGQTQHGDRKIQNKQTRSVHSTSSPTSNVTVTNHANINGTSHNVGNNSYRMDNHQNNARENLSSSFADSGVDLPVASNTDLEFPDSNPNTITIQTNLSSKYDSDELTNQKISSRSMKDRSKDMMYFTKSEVLT